MNFRQTMSRFQSIFITSYRWNSRFFVSVTALSYLMVPVLIAAIFLYTHVNNFAAADYFKFYAITWSMYVHHSYLVPIYNGHVYLDKPPLLFWMMMAGWHVFGVSTVWPQCLVALCVGIWALLARGIYSLCFPNDRSGRILLPWVLLASVAFIKSYTLLRVDLFLIISILLFIYTTLRYEHGDFSFRKTTSIYALVFLLGFMAKGPVVILFTLAPACCAYFKKNRDLLKAAFLGCLIGMVLTAVWLVPFLMRVSHRDELQVLYQQIWHRHSIGGRGALYYLGNIVPFFILPWAFALFYWQQFRQALRSVYQRYPFLIWAAFLPLVVFCFWGQKEPRYMLPTVILLLMFLTRGLLQRIQANHYTRFAVVWRALILVTILLFVAVVPYLPFVQSRYPVYQAVSSEFTTYALFVGAIVVVLSLFLLATLRAKVMSYLKLNLYFAVSFLMAVVCAMSFLSCLQYRYSNYASMLKSLQEIDQVGHPIYLYNLLYSPFVLTINPVHLLNTSKDVHSLASVYILSKGPCPAGTQPQNYYRWHVLRKHPETMYLCFKNSN